MKRENGWKWAMCGLAAAWTFGAIAQDYRPEALREVQARVEGGVRPVVIFDLDDTLFHSRTRTAAILRELGTTPSFVRDYPREAEAMRKVEPTLLRYNLGDSLRGIGIDRSEVHEIAMIFWRERFFSDEYAALDEVVRLAPEYVRSLAERGARIVYLSGRSIRGMSLGTRIALMQAGFPQGSVLLKPDPKMDDKAFKEIAVEEIRSMGEVVGVFENEPRNVNLLKEKFPQAVAIFLDTQHSSAPDVPEEGVQWIKDYAM